MADNFFLAFSETHLMTTGDVTEIYCLRFEQTVRCTINNNW